jgi:hypothetical protein
MRVGSLPILLMLFAGVGGYAGRRVPKPEPELMKDGPNTRIREKKAAIK